MMTQNTPESYVKNLLSNLPADWLRLTTHRLDIFNEERAKSDFLEELEQRYTANDFSREQLAKLPTAYDYIRLGHPLSSVLEWYIAKSRNMHPDGVIAFQSRTMPLLALLRKNAFSGMSTTVFCSGELAKIVDAERLKEVYNYKVEIAPEERIGSATLDSLNVWLTHSKEALFNAAPSSVDFIIQVHEQRGSLIVANGERATDYISEIQHVRRRESVAMTPQNCLETLQDFTGSTIGPAEIRANALAQVRASIRSITGAPTPAAVASSGLSIQYAVVMGLLHYAKDLYPGKPVHLIVPPNCYGGTNDQARRVAAVSHGVTVVDLPVDGENDMVSSVEHTLSMAAKADAVPFIIAEIPTNPRVEVPDLENLRTALEKERTTATGDLAVPAVFILDQTFCPNVHFLRENDTFAKVKALSYVSGSKFPSGGLCTAGYCVGNIHTQAIMPYIEQHLLLCDNQATNLQLSILAKQLPSMNQRIASAYQNTLRFVNFIKETLPEARINFVSEELAERGFTPSVFSLDLPTKGETHGEREAHKRMLNLKLINRMIEEIPQESKYCVSYGQLKGCYWTIPATSTQGTTKEEDKDYIVRVALSGDLDLEKHQEVFAQFAAEM